MDLTKWEVLMTKMVSQTKYTNPYFVWAYYIFVKATSGGLTSNVIKQETCEIGGAIKQEKISSIKLTVSKNIMGIGLGKFKDKLFLLTVQRP